MIFFADLNGLNLSCMTPGWLNSPDTGFSMAQ